MKKKEKRNSEEGGRCVADADADVEPKRNSTFIVGGGGGLSSLLFTLPLSDDFYGLFLCFWLHPFPPGGLWDVLIKTVEADGC